MMDLSSELAQPIINRLRETLECPISITNSHGVIIASSDNKRLGRRHEVALEAITSRSNQQTSKEQAANYANTFEGITLPLLLHGSCAGALCLRGKPEELKLYASIIGVAVISLLEVAEINYEASTRQRLVDSWVNNLISDAAEDFEQSTNQAHILGIDCRELCAVLVIRFSPVVYTELPNLEAAIVEVAQKGAGLHFASYVGQGQFVCAIPVADFEGETELQQTCDALIEKLISLRLHFHIGVGSPNRGIQGYRQSYHDAFHSARVAERLGEAKRILYYNEQHIFRLLESVPDYIRRIFIDNQTEGREWDPVLRETLQTYFAMDCRVNETAKALYIHRNTLLFRLNKISDTYGLDPRVFHDALVLQVLMYLHQLSKKEELGS